MIHFVCYPSSALFLCEKKRRKKRRRKTKQKSFSSTESRNTKTLADNFLFIFNKAKIMMKKQRSEGNENDINKK